MNYCLRATFFAVCVSACATDARSQQTGNYTNNAGSAAVMTGIAVTSSAVSRAQGGCYAACPTGTTCNTKTGMCDPLPCRGLCAFDEFCDQTATLEKCVKRPGPQMDIKIAPTPQQTPVPATPAPVTPD